MVTSMLHAGLNGYLAEQKASRTPGNPDGSISLVYDGQYRVTCLALARGELLLEARIFRLSADAAGRRTTMATFLEQAGKRLLGQTERIALAPWGQLLVLQQIVSAQADLAEFRTALDCFVNALAGWRRLAGVL